jgi:hypothetical protein
MNTTRVGSVLTTVCALASILPVTGRADARRFTFLYEATTAAPRSVEIENSVTWSTHQPGNAAFNQLDFRHEIEIGLTDHLQAGIYLADWSWVNDPAAHINTTRYTNSAVELICNLTNPTADAIGSAIYGEIREGGNFLELEGKLILQKNFGRWVFAYNATVESIWEGDHLAERSGEFSQALGVSYEISPRLLVGAELLHEVDIPNWSKAANQPVRIGPNISWRHGRWWLTVTPMVNVNRLPDEAALEVRTIFGTNF